MSPYLTNLLSRSFSAEPSLHPQASAPFVPKPADAGESWALPVEEESVGQVPYGAPSASNPGPVPHRTKRDDISDTVPDDTRRTLAGERSISAGPIPASLSSQLGKDSRGEKPVVPVRETPIPGHSDRVVHGDEGLSDQGLAAPSSTTEKALSAVPGSAEAVTDVKSVIVPLSDQETPRARASKRRDVDVESSSEFEATAAQHGNPSGNAMGRTPAAEPKRTVSRNRESSVFFPEQESAQAAQAPRDTTGAKSEPEVELGTRPRPLFAAANSGRAPQRATRATSREQQPPDREQVIEVTIGRIEVRASVTEERRAREPRTATLPSLEDYLRRRSGKERS